MTSGKVRLVVRAVVLNHRLAKRWESTFEKVVDLLGMVEVKPLVSPKNVPV
jgi:hypothetical protein